MVSNRIIDLKDKFDGSSDVFEFLSQWSFFDDCDITLWFRSLLSVPLSETRSIFKDLITSNQDIARKVHYDVGFMVTPEIRLEWVKVVATNSVEAAKMWLTDATLTDDDDVILEESFRSLTSGAPSFCKRIDSGSLTRVKDNSAPIFYNVESEVVKKILTFPTEV